jgi:cytoskeletal protein CcmA (bactofilin family)
MFSTSKKKSEAAAAPERKTTRAVVPTIISPDLHVTGDLATEGDMQIDGIIEGDVRSGSLAVGESAVVTGEIYAESVIIRGKVTGRIRARSVELAGSARVIGDIWHEVLSIDAGAFLEGHCKHMKSQEDTAVQTVEPDDNDAVPLQYPKSKGEKKDKPLFNPGKKAAPY